MGSDELLGRLVTIRWRSLWWTNIPSGEGGGEGGEYEASPFMLRKRNWIELSKCQSYEPVGLNKKLFFSKEKTEEVHFVSSTRLTSCIKL